VLKIKKQLHSKITIQ